MFWLVQSVSSASSVDSFFHILLTFIFSWSYTWSGFGAIAKKYMSMEKKKLACILVKFSA